MGHPSNRAVDPSGPRPRPGALRTPTTASGPAAGPWHQWLAA